MADAVQDDLRDAALTVGAFLPGLVVDGARQALERTPPRRCIHLAEREWKRRWIGPRVERDALVDGERLVDRKLADQQGRRSRRRILRGLQSRERRRRTGGARDSNDGGERQPSRQDHFLRALAPEARCVQGNRLCHGGR